MDELYSIAFYDGRNNDYVIVLTIDEWKILRDSINNFLEEKEKEYTNV